MARNVIFFADSHMGALNLGHRQLNDQAGGKRFSSDIYFVMPDVGNISRDFMLDLADGRRALNPVLVKTLSEPGEPGAPKPSILNRWTDKSPLVGTDHLVVFLWGFAEMHTFAFEAEWRDYGILGESADLEEPSMISPSDANVGRYYLPRQLVSDRLNQLIAPVLDVVTHLAQRGVNVATLAGPPPVRDNHAIKENFPAFNPAHPYTRLTIYRILLEIFRLHSIAGDYQFFEAPDKTMDTQGFRRKEFSGDCVHANAEYGAVILESLASTIDPS